MLVGFMGAGKSTAARALDPEALDTDELVEERLGRPVAEVFAREGEAAFRAAEAEVAGEALERADGGVVALGGGALSSERVRRALRAHRVVLLDVDAEEAWRRVRRSDRPLARDEAAFRTLHARRERAYLEVADVVVPADAAARIGDAVRASALLDEAPAGTRMLWAIAGGRGHPVLVGRALVGSGLWPLEGRRFLVTDTTVAGLYASAVAPVAGTVAVPPGEAAKTLATAERVWREMAAAGITRADHVAALGGGVVGDLGGFAAACYQRGVPVVQVPTTLVAQVDSAHGGKTGVDLPEGKNYVGAYHQPAAVLADPATLETLPPAEVAAGYAEVVKTALIAGGDLWERVRSGAEVDDWVILACARLKLAVVAADERDAGRRQVLNLGHTIGHAIETASGYGRYRHGEAVALGLLAALRLSGRDVLREEVAGLLVAAGLPERLRWADPDAVVAAVSRDKKRLGEGDVPFVLVEAPGDVRTGCRVTAVDVAAAVRELTGP